MCDALQPNVIWKDLRFDRLVGSNLLAGDFFENQATNCVPLAVKRGFHRVLGNPPFQSKFSRCRQKANEAAGKSRVAVPDKQMAHLIAEQAMPLLQEWRADVLHAARRFSLQRESTSFQKAFIAANQTETVLDFTSIRNLFDGADPKTVALVVTKRKAARPATRFAI